MRKIIPGKKSEHGFYTVLVLAVFIVVVITNIIQAFYVVKKYEDQALENYYEYAGNTLDQFKSSINGTIGNAMSLAAMFTADKEININVRAGTILNGNKLDYIKKSMFVTSNVIDVAFFNPDMDKIFSAKKGQYISYDDYWKGMTYQTVKNLEKAGVIKRKSQVSADVNEILTVCFVSDLFYDSYVIVDINFDEIKSRFKKYAKKHGCEMAVMAETGDLFFTDENLFQGLDSFDGLINTKTGKYGATSLKAESFGMRYVVLKDFDSIRKNYILESQLRFVIVYLAIFAVGLAMLYFSMKYSYRPIDKMIREYKKQYGNSEKESDERKLKEFITISAVNEKKAERVYNFVTKCLGRTDRLYLILVVIDGYHEFADMYTAEEQSAYKYAVKNVFTEIISEHYKCIAVENDAKSEFFLISDVDNEEHLREIIATGTKQLKIHLDISVTALIAENYEIYDLNDAYREIDLLANYRLVFPSGAIITQMNRENSEENVGVYEKHMKENAKKGDFAEMPELIEKYIYSLRNSEPGEIAAGLINLLSQLYDIIGQKYNISELSLQSMMQSILNAENAEEIKQVFKLLFEKAEREAEEFPGHKYKSVVDNVYAEINKSWADPYFCVDTIADRMKYSGVHLSRVFKSVTGKSLSMMIMQKRLEESAKILAEQDVPIKDIFEKCGFASNSYFSVLFKKQFGMSPGEYRRSIAEDKN